MILKIAAPYIQTCITVTTHKLQELYKYLHLKKVYKFITSSRDDHLGYAFIILKQFVLLFSGILGLFFIMHAISYVSPAFLQNMLRKPLHWYYNRVFLKYSKHIKRYWIQAKHAFLD